ncbi:hemerythrin domain-containing protein [Phytohabitans sp. ZYX-F-186]|uniref:Hemerythrin domain-containing protein n=1 Tax=Phytohabitans maris TaxID=3071409 RepID=A0ABU0ZQV2_9ACTN|nr:hemerythrin domain-containing protein [Phytohabitans sp. ZYX-F-186]MDQ7908302.1 hemerythrin domain-containing protein [Phytohabitans sp. ZYX-F-186]
MSQPNTDHADQTRQAADRRAARAVVRHHAALATTLADHVAALLEAASIGSSRRTWQRRDQPTGWLHAELLPHAAAEEAAMYPCAAAQPGGQLLVDGMMSEHRAITALVGEVETATTPMTAAAAARALSALFAAHLAKENDLILPLLVTAEQVSLADLLDGMHELLGTARASGDHGDCGCGDASDRGVTGLTAAGRDHTRHGGQR